MFSCLYFVQCLISISYINEGNIPKKDPKKDAIEPKNGAIEPPGEDYMVGYACLSFKRSYGKKPRGIYYMDILIKIFQESFPLPKRERNKV